MDMKFEAITLDKQEIYLEYLKKSGFEASDYSFINLWGWKNEYSLSWAFTDKLVWIKQSVPCETCWAPVGDWGNIKWGSVLNKYFPEGSKFIRVPETLKNIWSSIPGPKFEFKDIRDHWDYLYSVKELIDLKGKPFHKKKNLLNQFKKKYNYRFEPLTISNIPEALAMQEDWCALRDCESEKTLLSEHNVIARVLDRWNELENIFGGALYVEDEMVAFTVAEKMNEDTMVIHFEKGLVEFKGIYQAINRIFLSHKSNFKTVNREQDLGDPGLRKAKLSYNPTGYVKKYQAVFIA